MARNQITTIDIGTNAIKIMELVLTNSGMIIHNYGSMKYPRNSAGDRITDTTIIETLIELIKEKGFKTKNVALSIPRQLVTVKGLSGLPGTATDEDIAKMVPIQIETELPFSIEEAEYSIYNVQRTTDNVSLEIVAAKKTSIDRYIDIADKAGVKIGFIIPSAFATYGVVFDQLRENLANKNIAIADIGAGGTDLCVVQHGRLAFSRGFPYGGNNLTLMIEKEEGLTFESAEVQKLRIANLSPGFEEQITSQWADSLSNQIVQSIRAFTGKDSGAGIDSLMLCGGCSQIPGIAQYMSDKLDMDVSILESFSNIDTSLVRDNIYEQSLTVNIGLGLIALAGKDRTPTVNVNLLPKEILEKAKRIRQRILMVLSATMAVIVIAFGIWMFNSWQESQSRKYKAVEEQLLKLEKDPVIINARQTLEKSILMDRVMVSYVTPLEVLREMHEKLPSRDKLALTSFNMDKNGKLTLSVEAMSHADIGEAVQILSEMKSPNNQKLFESVDNGAISKITKDNKPILQVQIICTLSKETIQENGKNEKNNKS
ncbi:MAG: pilus assembly protein PilM [Candidatus Poribacteria bacterium]